MDNNRYTAKPLAFPSARSFSDLFDLVTTDKAEAPRDVKLSGTTMLLTPYCCVDGEQGYRSLYVRAKQEVVDYVARSLINIDGDHIYWRVCVRDDGTALVIVSYNKIIGSRWFALVDAKTVPGGER